MTAVAISRLHCPVQTLGPGRRIGIWFQGCSIRCPGCVSLDTWSHSKGATTVEAVLETASQWLAGADGITVSGGEPFDQPEALLKILSDLRRHFDGDILVYSGYPIEQLNLEPFDGLIDALMSDPFDRTASQSLALRGSDNQRLTALTELGRKRFTLPSPSKPAERALDVMFDDDSGQVFLVGIPRSGDMRRFTDLLEKMGHTVATSEDVRVLL
jgi:anaerobic ribonucleoside-triphosphate reductase activating protein